MGMRGVESGRKNRVEEHKVLLNSKWSCMEEGRGRGTYAFLHVCVCVCAHGTGCNWSKERRINTETYGAQESQ